MTERSSALAKLRTELAVETRRLDVLHAERLQCRRGCSSCCVDELTVFAVEAEPIRQRYAELLEHGVPHAEGACAFLDEQSGCRIYAERPYVCRTQGLPLRWLEEVDDGDDGEPAIVERRDICPLNEAGEDIVELDEDACWTLGPFEEQLARLEGAGPERVALRDLFAAARAQRDR